MALFPYELDTIVDLANRGPKPVKILSLGYPDVRGSDNVNYAREMFDNLGAEFTVLDQAKSNNIDEIVDFNYPIDVKHYNKYTLVVDPGTTEHCFNIGQVLKTIVQVMCVGGYAYHLSAMNMPNHGYWNYSPVAFYDFYTNNGYEVIRLEGLRKGERYSLLPLSRNAGNASMIICIARKLSDIEEIIFPIQGKYQCQQQQ